MLCVCVVLFASYVIAVVSCDSEFSNIATLSSLVVLSTPPHHSPHSLPAQHCTCLVPQPCPFAIIEPLYACCVCERERGREGGREGEGEREGGRGRGREREREGERKGEGEGRERGRGRGREIESSIDF